MPEGPEIKLSVNLISPLLIGKKIINAYPDKRGRYASGTIIGFEDFCKTINNQDCKIIDVKCKGKFMYWNFDYDWCMFSTFGMTGQWSPIEGKHPCFVFHLGENSASLCDYMYFNDPRHFGTIKFTNSKKELDDKLNELGWDPLSDVDGTSRIQLALRKTSKPIGQILMDQGIFAGVGNYIRAEALYLARMSPWVQSNLLTLDRTRELCECIVQVMKDSYAHQGATILTYKDAYGAEGKYSSCFKVYGQKKDPLGNPIVKEETPDGRTIHWCPLSQCEKF